MNHRKHATTKHILICKANIHVLTVFILIKVNFIYTLTFFFIYTYALREKYIRDKNTRDILSYLNFYINSDIKTNYIRNWSDRKSEI